ncbi:hypothetical protein TPHA_0L02250 [Tetrapisispora phaffii CBS 4417]|uniref:Exonuclease domain-containing protein n=1 Tax=Tetrapisispora phaffii (strain ATCC 24235 / CBS 4417 / NBRC 1672 / NRRL Y-8282 / UCD 70-5) TaxID=1071381 RepID=G8C098_TETPH|nr:hypothetical protein TPHA_0L02250 [Tetrapisispora phaffii CBS 4417]CCE65576.1 hypothetical protein TPHA_0L02250 [Tetrapisispora phaffii CBS 4417]
MTASVNLTSMDETEVVTETCLAESVISGGAVALESESQLLKKRRRSSASKTQEGSIKESAETLGETVKKKKKKQNKNVTFKISEKALEKRISIKDLRDLTLFLMNSTNNAPKWIDIENRSSIQKVVVLFVPGLEPADYNLPKDSSFHESNHILKQSKLNIIKDISENDSENVLNFPVSAPGSRTSLFSAYNSFVNVGLTKKEKEDKKKELDKKQITINDLVLDVNDLLRCDYPIHLETEGIDDQLKEDLISLYKENDPTEEWVNTVDREEEESHIYALDCEMCMSENGLVLTRISIVNFDGKVVYDKLVKPDVPIIDYLTKYSGITEEKLEGISTTLKDVQHDILKLISKRDILIGHSLQSDFNVLKLRHTKVVDTAVCFDHKAGPPFRPSLKFLTSEFIGRDIQNDNDNGHDSIEDAIACLELVKLKIVNGLIFGIAVNTENLFLRLSKIGIRSLCLNDSTSNKGFQLVNNLAQTVGCNDDTEILNKIQETINDYQLFVGRLRNLEFSRNFAQPSIGKNVAVLTAEQSLKLVQDGVQKVYDNAPGGTAIFLLSGSGDTREWSSLMKELNSLNKEDKQIERQKKDEEIQRAVFKARDGVASMVYKQHST